MAQEKNPWRYINKITKSEKQREKKTEKSDYPRNVGQTQKV